MKNFLCFCTLFWVLLAAHASVAETVIAKGMSFFEPGREAIAREKALAEAKRVAIEQAVGAHVESRTVVSNFQLSRDQVLSHAAGYIRSMKMLKESKTDLGTYEVEIEADVALSDLVQDMDRFKKVLGWQKNPRVAITFSSNVENSLLPATRKVASLLASKLKADGFRVFDPKTASTDQMSLIVKINVDLSSSASGYQGVQLQLHEVGLTADIFRPRDGEILASASAVKSLGGANRLVVLNKGTNQCVDAIWQQLRQQLTQTWETELYSQRAIDLVLKNVDSYAQAMEISAVFGSSVSSVADVQLISFENRVAEYSLQYKGWPQYLLNEIEMAYFKRNHFNSVLEQVRDNRIVLKLLGKDS